MKKILLVGLATSILLVGYNGNSDKKEVAKIHSAPSDNLTLKIYNWEDYINTDEETGELLMIEKFKDYYYETYGVTPDVRYYTFDTNETMYNNVFSDINEQYDLICPSDYIIEKLMKTDRDGDGLSDLIEEIDLDRIPNYRDNVSPYLHNVFKDNGFDKYSVGYMWGTMGLTYYEGAYETINEDIKSWDVLWNSNYKNKISVKDSMRDTYVVGIMSVYKEALDMARQLNEEGKIDDEYYKNLVQEYFDRHDDKTLEKVERALKDLKKNIYGFEVDSGKYDVVTGKVDINLAWSGDAVESIDTALEETPDRPLKYYVPDEGSNVWFDGWIMPKGANKELAYEFLNFISNPENAVENMDYIGYTTFIGGDAVKDYISESYCEVEEGVETITKDLTFYFTDDPESERIVFEYPKSEEYGRFDTQFPDEEILKKCAIMHDFGEANNRVVEMWTRVLSSELNATSYIFLGILVLGIIGYCIYFAVKKQGNKKRRSRRLAERKL